MSRLSAYKGEMNYPMVAEGMELHVPVEIGMRSTAEKLAAAIKATGHEFSIVPSNQVYKVYKMNPKVTR
jgi:hypothetical protein